MRNARNAPNVNISRYNQYRPQQRNVRLCCEDDEELESNFDEIIDAEGESVNANETLDQQINLSLIHI